MKETFEFVFLYLNRPRIVVDFFFFLLISIRFIHSLLAVLKSETNYVVTILVEQNVKTMCSIFFSPLHFVIFTMVFC